MLYQNKGNVLGQEDQHKYLKPPTVSNSALQSWGRRLYTTVSLQGPNINNYVAMWRVLTDIPLKSKEM